jgi:hypothetical protein
MTLSTWEEAVARTMEMTCSHGHLEMQPYRATFLFPPGNEDLSYSEAKREWYTVREWQNQRYILAYKK